ncbi:hypothetical protein [Streptomyces blattellae]|uniref:hypothetical protein n=1 Tax=Streptomyces blattellae TaxID=2569855 RepID=UPI0012B78C8D|nr:hypothetical protein [Streptomyces blattellae]
MALGAVSGRSQTRSHRAETHLEHLTITRKTVTGLADRLPAVAPDLPEHPDHPRVLAAFDHTEADTDPCTRKHQPTQQVIQKRRGTARSRSRWMCTGTSTPSPSSARAT